MIKQEQIYERDGMINSLYLGQEELYFTHDRYTSSGDI